MHVKVLGCGREVGRSAFLVHNKDTALLLDYGVKPTDARPEFPLHVSPKDVDAAIISHAHLDHIGALPGFYVSEALQCYMTRPTLDMGELLIKDLIHLSRYYIPYELLELTTLMRTVKFVNYRQTLHIGGATVTFFDAGHIPGSMFTRVEMDGRRVLYTGDFNTAKMRLVNTADEGFGEVDYVILESTYCDTEHGNRLETETKFVDACRDVVEGGGVALVPAFSIGRSQELLCTLAAHRFEYPITVDGMAREATRVILKHGDFLREPSLLSEALQDATVVGGWEDRKKACKRPGVIISPAGMLRGGAAVHYMQHVGREERNAVFLVAYQIEGTPGRMLLDQGKFAFGARLEKARCRVGWFDFSAHAGKSELLSFVGNLKGKPQIILVHGDWDTMGVFAQQLRDENGLQVVTPENGEEIAL